MNNKVKLFYYSKALIGDTETHLFRVDCDNTGRDIVVSGELTISKLTEVLKQLLEFLHE